MKFFRWGQNNQPPHQPPAGNDNKDAAGKTPATGADAPKHKNKKPKAQKQKGDKPRLRDSFGKAVRGARNLKLSDLTGTAGSTLRDLRQPREIGLLIVAIIVPGGMMGWSAYRFKKFKEAQPANQNILPPETQALPAKQTQASPAQDQAKPQQQLAEKLSAPQPTGPVPTVETEDTPVAPLPAPPFMHKKGKGGPKP